MLAKWKQVAHPAIAFAVLCVVGLDVPAEASRPNQSALIDTFCGEYSSRYFGGAGECRVEQMRGMLLTADVAENANIFRREDIITALCMEQAYLPDLETFDFAEAATCIERTGLRTAEQLLEFYRELEEGGR